MHFVPVGIETYGAYGPQGIRLVKQIEKKIQDATGETHCLTKLFLIYQNKHLIIRQQDDHTFIPPNSIEDCRIYRRSH